MGQYGISLFSNYTIGILLFITHFVSSIILGILLGLISRFKKINNSQNFNYNNTKINFKHTTNYANLNNLGIILSNAILDSIKNILTIGGFIVIFSIIISLLNTTKILDKLSLIFFPITKFLNINLNYFKGLLLGIIELTNGVYYIAQISTKYISLNILFISFLLGFGGFSIILQVLSITSNSNLSIKKYIIGKFAHGIISLILTYLLLNILPFFNFNL